MCPRGCSTPEAEAGGAHTPSRSSEQHHNKPPPTPKLAGVEGCGMKSRDAAILQLLISCPWVTKCTFPWLPEFCCQLLWRPCRASHPKCSYPATFLQGIQLQEKNTSSVVIDGRFCSSGRKRWSMVHRGDEHSQGLDLARARSFPLSPVIQMKAQGTGGF